MFPIGAVIEVQKFLYKHVAAYIGHGMVLQNHPIRGEEIVPLETFSNGQKITMRSGAVKNRNLFLERVRMIASNPKPYDLFSNNCEQTVYTAVDGKPKSPQLAFAFLLLSLGLVLYKCK